MLKNKNIICISSIDWDFIWQGHQEIMSTLAKNGNRVLFIENTGVRAPGLRDISRIRGRIKNWLKGVKGIRKEADNLYVFSPLVLPFPYSRIARWVNRHLITPVLDKWIKVMDFSDSIIWTFLPTPLSIDIADSIVKKLFIYYCIDNFSVSSMAAKKIKESEERLLKKVDLVFVTSGELYNYCFRYSDKVHKFPFAVNFEKFEEIRLKNDSTIPDELKDIKAPIVGYVGGVHKWIDQGLIRYIAETYPSYSFVFIGPIQTDVSLLSGLKNVYFLGSQDHGKLPFFIKDFDACIIPYRITDYTRNVYPTKLNEYLAMGKPVISTALPETKAFNKTYDGVVYLAGDKKIFADYVKKSQEENNQVLVNRRIDAAKDNSWENRIEKMSSLIGKEIEKKELDREIRWKENLLIFYKRVRNRAMRFVAVCFLLYVMFFKTSFIWFLAEPLKIANPPQKANAIVVFGGGVGETGSPGRSTIERARYAAELYKKGYANKVIFSSGYIYNYNDAENMKLFAISMGVPEKDIILEGMANSAYENVKFSSRILSDHGFNKVLVVSSCYNMRRVQLVFNKLAGAIKVIYTPVEKNQFYDRSEGVKLEQIKAIMHEYLGIVYYFFKGYI